LPASLKPHGARLFVREIDKNYPETKFFKKHFQKQCKR